MDYRTWRHVFKLDPERTLSDEALDRVCLSGTDAVMVGGTTGVTFDNTVDLLGRIRRYEVPCVQEISTIESVVPGFDLYMIPVVLNTDDGRWITGQHQMGLREYGALIDWEAVVPEGYVILNPDSSVARLTGAKTELDGQDLAAYGRLADRLLRLPILYVEYSGMFGEMDKVRRASAVLHQARLFYGGGVDSPDKARQAAGCAHTVVVGNVLYDDLDAALATVAAVRSVPAP
ncbi:heptaprenylglyceryl phosphate synthase [Paenibacillus sp. J31TS4]|uniref:heptaprenylglyceryl phosphate synthase n=1 Tax=Paenibacillus sp. J31TS4 TaxID=2807195 RepID=UPI001B031EBC|nr:heptaprenylglyceryl phosphate synthase [Paenibacillus sp. J31TS4]GIP41031.1 heptaprenylglyceryl phosphate synthase [Paenibacillus sp. J31TS4]